MHCAHNVPMTCLEGGMLEAARTTILRHIVRRASEITWRDLNLHVCSGGLGNGLLLLRHSDLNSHPRPMPQSSFLFFLFCAGAWESSDRNVDGEFRRQRGFAVGFDQPNTNTQPNPIPICPNPNLPDLAQSRPIPPIPIQFNPIQSNPVQPNPTQSKAILPSPIQSNPFQPKPPQPNPTQSKPIKPKLIQPTVQSGPSQSHPFPSNRIPSRSL